MAETRMRFRTDSTWIADAKRKGESFWDHYDGKRGTPWYASKANRKVWDATPAAQHGDTWRTRWWKPPTGEGGPIAGYAICCPTCREIHHWTTALNCATKRPLPDWEYTDPSTGAKRMITGNTTCDHMGKGSCWTWTGSAERNELSAQPSLHSLAEKGGCGWHGFLTNGVLKG